VKHFCKSFAILALISCSLVSYSQNISTGIYSGVNFSDIHGQATGGNWVSKPGPIQGFYLQYSFNKSIGIQTGINLSTIYFRHKQQNYPVYYDFTLSSERLIAPSYYQGAEDMDFRFLRIPLLVDINIPSTLQFDMRAGIFFSFLQSHDLNIYYFGNTTEPGKHDFGYMFSSGIAYPLNDAFKVTFNASYLTGRKHLLENYYFRNGSSEFTLGVAYSGFQKNKNSGVQKIQNDSISRKVIVTITSGFLHSWNGGDEINGKYHGNPGLTIGFSLKFPLGRSAFFQTGFSFERKGFSIRDSSASFYRIIKDNSELYYVNTKVQTDYAIIPALISLPVGKPDFIYITTGPWLGLKLNSRNVGVAYNVTHSQTSYELVKTIIYDDTEKLMKNYDLGWIFGCGLSLPVAKSYKIDIGLQYSTGFRDVFSNAGQIIQQNPNDPGLMIKNRTISLLFGIRIP
jgi:hypothetical protein